MFKRIDRIRNIDVFFIIVLFLGFLECGSVSVMSEVTEPMEEGEEKVKVEKRIRKKVCSVINAQFSR